MVSNTATVVETDVVYAGGERPLRWNIYRPASIAKTSPVVLVFHGGGWRAGDRSAMANACQAFAGQGYIAIAPEYRLIGEVEWPKPLEDVRTAIRAVRAGAGSLCAAPDHIFLAGYSAGAHLALLAASGAWTARAEQDEHGGRSEAIAGVAAFFPPARIGREHGPMLGLEDEEALVAISPMAQADRLPPTIVFCGDDDTMTPADLSLDLYKAIRSAGGTCDLRLFSHLIHEFVSLPGMMETTVRDAVEFFERTAINKAGFDAALKDLHNWWARIRAPAS